MDINLNFESGTPIAQVDGGDYDGEICYLHSPDQDKVLDPETGKLIQETKKIPINKVETLFKKLIHNYVRKDDGMKQLDKLITHIKQNDVPEDEDMKELFNDISNNKIGIKGDEITLDEGEFQQFPNPNKRECLYICGQSGVGKSVYAARYARKWLELFPGRPAILFSLKEDDPAFDEIPGMYRMIMDDGLFIRQPILYKELENSLCIFDDIDTIPNKLVKDAALKLANQLLEVGRSSNIYVIRMSHLINKALETKIVINEATSVTLFPRATIRHNLDYFLKEYIGLDKKAIEKIVSLPSRWVTIKKGYPSYILYEKGVCLTSKFSEE